MGENLRRGDFLFLQVVVSNKMMLGLNYVSDLRWWWCMGDNSILKCACAFRDAWSDNPICSFQTGYEILRWIYCVVKLLLMFTRILNNCSHIDMLCTGLLHTLIPDYNRYTDVSYSYHDGPTFELYPLNLIVVSWLSDIMIVVITKSPDETMKLV